MTLVSRGTKSRNLPCERDLEVDTVPSLSPQNHIRRFVKGINYVLFNVQIAFKYITKCSDKIFTAIIRLKSEYASPFQSPYLRGHVALLQRSAADCKKCT